MPTLACRICGRVVYTAASLDSLFAEERRCPRCGGMLFAERRAENRRQAERRTDPTDPRRATDGNERRSHQQRMQKRRRDDDKAL